MRPGFAFLPALIVLIVAGLALPPAVPRALAQVTAAEASAFQTWLEALKREAAGRGISQATITAALDGVRPVPRILELDQRQPEFVSTFWSYTEHAVSEERVEQGVAMMATQGPLLRKISARYGVPPRVLVAIWGLESNYGQNPGGYSVISSLVTLAYDQRRSKLFRAQLFDALKILDQGHIRLDDMLGSWAGAMGQVQFMPSTFMRYAVDQNGDGRRDIWNSLPDAFASAASFLRAIGWKPGQNWGREVRLPAGFDLNTATLKIKKTVNEWRNLGVRRADGGALPSASLQGSILLPAGQAGPAFLVYQNYRTILGWNRSTLYALAVGILSDRVAGRPGLVATAPTNERRLSRAEVEEMQKRLLALGYDVGEVDGVMGSRTRAALRSYQQRSKLPPDGYPTPEILEHLRQAGNG